jgi:hypothetical protein
MVSVLLFAQANMLLTLDSCSTPPSTNMLPTTSSVPPLAPLPMVTVPVLLMRNRPLPVVRCPPSAVVPTLMAAVPSLAWPTVRVAAADWSNLESVPWILSVAEVVVPPDVARFRLPAFKTAAVDTFTTADVPAVDEFARSIPALKVPTALSLKVTLALPPALPQTFSSLPPVAVVLVPPTVSVPVPTAPVPTSIRPPAESTVPAVRLTCAPSRIVSAFVPVTSKRELVPERLKT